MGYWKVVATDLGSKVTTQNKLYDAETGEVLLTQTQNDFEDPVYNLTYPAHWAYDGMGPAAKNSGIRFNNITIDEGIWNFGANPSPYFMPGDELLITGNSSAIKAWVYSITGNEMEIIDEFGSYVNYTDASIKIVRSGRRNQQTTPIGSITSLGRPYENGMINIDNDSILNASAVEFDDEWNTVCDCGFQVGDVVNPYTQGILGNWRAKKSWLYLTNREQMTASIETRYDGLMTTFSPFWTLPANTEAPWTPTYAGWQSTSEVTKFSSYGAETENKDALGRYSSALYGYNYNLPTAVSSNAKKTDIAFDNFEDYYQYQSYNGYSPICYKRHFSFEQSTPTLENNITHSGRNSVKLQGGEAYSVTKKLECAEEPLPREN